MVIFEFLSHIFVTILVSYLAATNYLAEKIELLISHENEPAVAEETLERLVEPSGGRAFRRGSLPTVLLNHPEFQQAATIASSRDEDVVTLDETIPLEIAVKNALVNIYCQYKTEEYIRTTTGSGFFINQKGVIITNAHIAQFLLLESVDTNIQDARCVVRTGDPATARYHAELLYISPMWIFENAELIDDEAPQGTGERDYALLYVSSSADNTPLPTHFPAIPFNTALLSRSMTGSSVITAGYPAGSLMRGGVDAKLLPVTAASTIGTLYTFGSNYADIFSVSGSPVGEQGASGGPIVTPDRSAIGLIVTKGDEALEGNHSLRALTLSYVDRTMVEETGFTLAQNMQGDVAQRGAIFKRAMVPFLADLLEEELGKSTR